MHRFRFWHVLVLGLALVGVTVAVTTSNNGTDIHVHLPRLGQRVTVQNVQKAQEAATDYCQLPDKVAAERKVVNGAPGEQKAVDHDSGDCVPHASFRNKAAVISHSALIGDWSNNDPVYGVSRWRAIRSHNIQGAWLKTSEGATFRDRTTAAMARDARAAGLKVGGYHFAHVCLTSSLAEATVFVQQLRAAGLDSKDSLRPILDVEYGGCSTQSGSRAWIASLYHGVQRALPGIRLGVYSGNWWLAPRTGCLFPSLPSDTLSWISGYPSASPPCGHALDVHQFTDHYANGANFSDMSRLVAASGEDVVAGEGASVPPTSSHAKKLCGELKRIRRYIRRHGGRWHDDPTRLERAKAIKRVLAVRRHYGGYAGAWVYECKTKTGCRHVKA